MERITLTARDGYIYTNGESYGRIIYLAVGANPDDWHEITDAEYQAILDAEAESFPV